MEIAEIYYKAKDGRIFTDPLKCEEYEKNLGVLPGTIGQLVKALEANDPEHLLSMMILWYDEEKGVRINRYVSIRLSEDDDPLAFEKDLTMKVGDAVKELKKLPQDAEAQWIGYTVESFSATTYTLNANCNRSLFDMIEEKKKKK